MAKDNGYADLQALVAEARSTFGALDPSTVNDLTDAEVTFKLGGNAIAFVAKDFPSSFSLPSFYFHASTASDILGHKGVPIGKRDFLGQLRIKQ